MVLASFLALNNYLYIAKKFPHAHRSILHPSCLPFCLPDLDSMESCSHCHPHLFLRSTSQAIHASSFRSMQIKPSLDETNHTDMLLSLSREKPRSLATIGSRTHLHVRTEYPALSPMRHHDFLMYNSSINHTRCLIDHVNR